MIDKSRSGVKLCAFVVKALAVVYDQFIFAAALHHFPVAGRKLLMSAAVGVLKECNVPYRSAAVVKTHAEVAGGYKDQQCERYGEYGPEGSHYITNVRIYDGAVLQFGPKTLYNSVDSGLQTGEQSCFRGYISTSLFRRISAISGGPEK